MADAAPETLAARLRELDAPPEVSAWAEEHGSFDDAWEACPSARHRIWLAAVSGVPVETVAESAAAGFFAVAPATPAVEQWTVAVEESVSASDAESAAALAERCERASTALGSYREMDRTTEAAIARAAALVCRAFEALRSAESAFESERLLGAYARASYLAGGVHAFLPAEAGPASLVSMAPGSVAHGLLISSVAAAAESAAILAATFASDVEALDGAVWDTLAPG